MRGRTVALRALEPSDAELMYAWENDMELWVCGNTLKPFSLHDIRCYIESYSEFDIYQSRQLRLMVVRADDGTPVGMIDFFDFDPFHRRGGIGIMIHRPFREQGYAAEALGLFVAYMVDFLGLKSLYATVAADNEPSIRLFEGAGFACTGVRKSWLRCGDEFKDELFLQYVV